MVVLYVTAAVRGPRRGGVVGDASGRRPKVATVTTPSPHPSERPGAGSRPAPLVVAASLAALEGLGLVLLAVAEVASIDGERVSLGVSVSVFFLLVAAAVLACAAGLLRLAAWARGPLLLTQLIALGLAWNVKDLWLVSVLLVVAALVALAGMLHPDTMRALGTLPPAAEGRARDL